MKKLVPFFIVLLGGLLRLWQYEYFPVGGETADEGAWTMLGASLIQERVPASWSYFTAYEAYHYREGVYDAPVVRPAFDHPPLFALIPGVVHSLKSHWLDLPSLKVVRLPMVLLGTVQVWLFWLVAKRLFPKTNWALAGTLLFATVPSIVFGSRLVVAENLLVTWVLLALLVALNLPTGKTRWWLVALSAAAVLTKMTGFIVPASLVIAGGITKRRDLTLGGLLGAGLGAVLFCAYGAAYNWPLFVSVFLTQAGRDIGLATLHNRLFLHPVLVKHAFFDGWKWLGLLATFFAFTHPGAKKFTLVHTFTLTSLLFIAATTGESTFHGWYDLMMWPSLILSITALFQTLYETGNGVLTAFAWLFLLPTVRLAAVATDTLANLSSLGVRLGIGLGVLPLAGQWLGSKKLFHVSAVLLFLLLILCNSIPVFSFTHVAYWQQAAFFEIW